MKKQTAPKNKMEVKSFLDFPLERSNHTMRRKMKEFLDSNLDYLNEKQEWTDEEAELAFLYAQKLTQLKKYNKERLKSETFTIE